MVFSSLTFITLFLPIILIVYYIAANNKLKNLVLLVFSLVFYSWGEPVYLVLMVFSIISDYFHALLIEKNRGNSKSKLFLISSIIINLSLLGFFKYGDFLIDIVNNILAIGLGPLELPLPIGISFYTFQTMSYTIDVYRGNTRANKNLLEVAIFVTLFPQLIAGPIVRYVTIEDQLKNRIHSIPLFKEGLRRFVFGLSKKVIIANQVAMIADEVFNGSYKSTPTIILWIGVIAYSFQIYFDFSGYSDMAIGLGKMFGFKFLENFNYPYMSKSITEFWRRWHISLGSWFKDYLYIPLGGNKKRKFFNIFLVWFLTGLWHGASYNYIIWGLYFCIILLFEKYIFKDILEKTSSLFRHIYTIILFLIGWVIFREENLYAIFQYIRGLLIYSPLISTSFSEDFTSIFKVIWYLPIAFLGSFLPAIIKKYIKKTSFINLVLDIYLIILLLVSLVFLFGERYNPFIYFRF